MTQEDGALPQDVPEPLGYLPDGHTADAARLTTPSPEPEIAWLHEDGRIWVESGSTLEGGRKLHLAGWANGVDPIQPDGTDLRDDMKPLYVSALNIGYHDKLAKARDTIATYDAALEQERMKAVAVQLAAEGHWTHVDTVVGNRTHPCWSPALDAVAALAAQPAATAAGRPDGHLGRDSDRHDWMSVGGGRFVCIACDPPGTTLHPSEPQVFATWPCAEAVRLEPSLAHYNSAWPVGTPVTFPPHGVGDPEQSTTSTPVWLGKDHQPYVSVHAYPPARGAALKLSDLQRVNPYQMPEQPLGAVEELDRYGR